MSKFTRRPPRLGSLSLALREEGLKLLERLLRLGGVRAVRIDHEVALEGADRRLDLVRLAGVVERLERNAPELELRGRLPRGPARGGGDALVGGLSLRVGARELAERRALLRLQRLADRIRGERRAERRARVEPELTPKATKPTANTSASRT